MLYLTDEPFLADTIKGRMSTDQTDDSKDKLKLANRQIDKATAIVLRAAKARRQADNEIERREAMKQLKAWNVKLKRGKEAALVADAEIPHAGIDAASVARQFRRDFTDFARLPIGRRKALFAHYVERCILVRRPTNEVPPEIQVQFILKADVPPVDSPEGTPRQSKPSRLVMVSHLRAATLPRSGSQR
jgi:hypothetical protein